MNTTEEISSEVIRIIRELMPEYSGELTSATSFEDIGLDSLSRVDLVVETEALFDVEVPDSEVPKLVRISDVAGFVLANRAAV